MTPRIAVRVDAGAAAGVGHAVRCLALCQELVAREAQVTTFGALEVPWVRQAYEDLGVRVLAPELLADAEVTHAVIDGYEIPADVGARLRERGVRVLALVDDRFGAHQSADVYVDQNFGATPAVVDGEAVAVAGATYTLFRDEVLAARDEALAPSSGAPRVLAVFGGTDPFAAAPDLARLLLHTGEPLHLVAVAATDAIADDLAALPRHPGQTVEIVRRPPSLPALAVSCDAAVSAAGSTIWELLCLGVPTASVCVIDNQEVGYRATVDAGLTLAGGRLPRLRSHEPDERAAEEARVTGELRRLLTDPALRERLARTGRSIVDGRGRERVAELLLRAAPPGSRTA